MQAIVPNLIVPSIEDCLPFYLALGFEKAAEVAHPPDGEAGSPLGFVILKHGATELMLQSTASLALDVAPLGDDRYRSVLYVRVTSLEPIRAALKERERVVPERTTFYGARELIVRDPAGNALFFAAHE